MATYQTPGVYVEEISTLPPSVAEVSTAVPVFIGYTERGFSTEEGSGPTVARVNTLMEYEEHFGVAMAAQFTAETHTDSETGLRVLDGITLSQASTSSFLMHHCLSLYFKNGGGSCYAVSIGGYQSTPVKAHFEAGLKRIEQEDEPTLIVLTDAVNLPADDYYALCQQALAQCEKLGDRFVVLDVKDGNIEEFRNSIGTNHLMYGAAYYPYLQTSLNPRYVEQDVVITGGTGPAEPPGPVSKRWERTFGDNGIVVSFSGSEGNTPRVQISADPTSADPTSADPTSADPTSADPTSADPTLPVAFVVDANRTLTISNVGGRNGAAVVESWATWKNENNPQGFELAAAGDGSGTVESTGDRIENLEVITPDPAAGSDTTTSGSTLASLKSTETALYNQIKSALSARRVVMPPSPAIAGVYASVDRDRGVWKAPANVTLSSVIGPLSRVSHDAQESLNVDAKAGKSINAIRSFTGKGTLVWGARTLAGNDNEWRYVPVRRLFIMIEESTKKATAFAVFEPNDATTWLKVKGMIESYLYSLWERGALAGPTPEAAYFINVGLGKTMTPQDVLEGRMIVEIGVAAVRPAEFIILRFTHKLQEA
ncbi:MAG: phage tail sheath subtilisin-like domain-containing protein [Proteobacteria bacterium]|nr:phage tail sheath subtilisin-like domain-containing protein [Pseudomonadota bacterium]